MQTKRLAWLAIALALSVTTVAARAQVTVGGASMYASKDIIDNAVNSKDHTTLVAAVKAAGLVGKTVSVTDEGGGISKVTIADVNQSNGVIHVIDKVLRPK